MHAKSSMPIASFFLFLYDGGLTYESLLLDWTLILDYWHWLLRCVQGSSTLWSHQVARINCCRIAWQIIWQPINRATFPFTMSCRYSLLTISDGARGKCFKNEVAHAWKRLCGRFPQTCFRLKIPGILLSRTGSCENDFFLRSECSPSELTGPTASLTNNLSD